ncbi:MAG: hypothetical protein WCL07_01830 [bacterium]
MAQKITRYLLIALILSLGFGQLGRYELLNGAIYIHDVLIVIILLINISHIKLGKSLGLKLVAIGIIIGWANALSLYPITSLLLPALYTVRLTMYSLIYFTLSGRQYKLPIRHFLLSGFIAILIGTIQYFYMPDMRIFQYLGWDDHLNRVIMPHYDPTFSSVMFALTGLLAYETKHYWLASISLPAILLSYARSTWLSIFLSIVSKLKMKIVLIIGLCLIILPIVFLPNVSGEGTNLLRTYSISSRFNHDLDLVKKVGWRTVLGEGYNTLSMQIIPAKDYASHASGANNSYLQILLTTGVLGLLGTILILSTLYKSFPYPAILSFILISSLFNNVLLYPFVTIWLILLVLSTE